MFKKAIEATTLTSEVADRLFPNITDENTPDKSFLATLRALLRTRLPSNESVHLTCINMSLSKTQFENSSPAQRTNWYLSMAARVQDPEPSAHRIFIFHTGYSDSGEDLLNLVQANSNTAHGFLHNYKLQNDLHVYYRKNLNALFYIDTTKRNTIIFTSKLELKHFHALQMTISRYLSLLFADNPLTDCEMSLLKSLESKSSEEYERAIVDCAKGLDIRKEIIRSQLGDFVTAYERSEIDKTNDTIKAYEQEHADYLAKAYEISNKIRDVKYRLAGLESVVNEQAEDSELMTFFIRSKNLTLVKTTLTSIEFVAHGYADLFDEEAFERYASNHGGCIYQNLRSGISKDQMEKLYRALFSGSETRYRLRICAAYTADVQKGLRACSGYDFPSESQTYLPNPHIQKHGCVGTNSARFHECIQSKDYVGAISQAIASARSLDFHDSTVMKTFAKDLSATQIKCIENSNGQLLTPLEAIKELEASTSCHSQ